MRRAAPYGIYATQARESLTRALQAEVQGQQRIASLRRQLSDAEENERARIARELHDDLAQRHSAVALTIQTLEDRSLPISSDDSLSGSIRTIQGSIRDLAHDVHGISRRLHPTVLDDLGLTAALRSECAHRGERAGFTVEFEHDGSAKDRKGETGLALFRIVQEALQNVATHAHAGRVIVRLHSLEETLVLEVEDDGRGISNTISTGPGIGLASMQERSQLVGGTFEISQAEKGGTIVRVSIPLTTNE